jgi:hypothetical protein
VSDKIARLGIERDNDLMYYIKNGDVWATPRKQKGQPKGKAQKIAATGLDLDYSRYLYFLDSDGDVARKERALGGGRKAKGKAAKPTKAAKPSAVPAAPKKKGKKSEAQLDAEIDECLAKVGAAGYTVSKASNGSNGTKPAGKPAAKTKKKKRR